MLKPDGIKILRLIFHFYVFIADRNFLCYSLYGSTKGVILMAIQKSEATRTFTEECRSEFQDLERQIDEEIRIRYMGHGMTIHLRKFPNEKVLKALEEVYKGAGWEVFFRDDKREGASITLR